MSNKFKVNYDLENDVLFIYNSIKKSHGSIEYGSNVHISFSSKNDVTGLEFLEASKTLSLLSKSKISKNLLGSIKKVNLETEINKGLLLIRFSLFFEETAPVMNQLVVQDINYISPVTA